MLQKIKNLLRQWPQKSLRRTAKIFNQMEGQTIVEVGTMRPSKFNIPDQGMSTLLWAKETAAKQIFSVDLDEFIVNNAKRILKKHKHVKILNDDGVKFLDTFKGTIDLLYLDAADIGVKDYKEIHLKMYIKAKSKMSQDSLILIDDTDIDSNGKGELVIPAAIKDGFKVVYSGRQTLLRRG